MKVTIPRFVIFLLLIVLIGVVTVSGWPLYLKHSEDSSLRVVGRHAREITSVEILCLSERGESGPAGSYLVRYDNSRRGIDSRKTLTGSESSDLVRLWTGVRLLNENMAMCHYPGFVLRFLKGQRCLLEVAVCFDCENISWQAAPFYTACRQMLPEAFDKKSRTEALKTFLTQLP